MTELLKMINSMKKLYDHLCLEVCNKYQLTKVELDILLFLHNAYTLCENQHLPILFLKHNYKLTI